MHICLAYKHPKDQSTTHALQFGKLPYPFPISQSTLGQSSMESSTASSSTGLACLIIIIIISKSSSGNGRFALPFCIETCNQNFQIFSVCVRNKGVKRVKGRTQGNVCTLQTDTRTEWITISTQFNEKCRPISKLCAGSGCTQCPCSSTGLATSPMQIPWGALGKWVHFGAKNNMFSKRHFHLCCMLCTHFRKCTYRFPTLWNNANANAKAKASATLVAYTHSLVGFVILDGILELGIAMRFGRSRATPSLPIPLCGTRLEHFVTWWPLKPWNWSSQKLIGIC